MKKLITINVICLLMLMLSSCKSIAKNDDELLDIARKHVSTSNSEIVKIAGYLNVDDKYLYWFITGDDNQAHTYIPIEFLKKDDGKLEYIHTYKPIERISDIACLLWDDNYTFVVNNKECKYIRIINVTNNIQDIEVKEYPFVYLSYENISEYYFLDNDKNVLA